MLMIRYHTYDIVFKELPGEIALAFTITGCTNNCEGCHSPHLQSNTGEILNINNYKNILELYKNHITAICFLGGEKNHSILELLEYSKTNYPDLKIGLYSGNTSISTDVLNYLDYLKLGNYDKNLGPLTSRLTNQQYYKIKNGKILKNLTHLFWE